MTTTDVSRVQGTLVRTHPVGTHPVGSHPVGSHPVTIQSAATRSLTRLAVWHYVEMSIAMGLGMAILGPLARWGFATAGWSSVYDRMDLHAMIMATEMSIAMVAWMWFRKHSWGSISEMTAVMYLPFVVLLVPFWAGVLSGGMVLALGHVLMFLAMAVVVYRRRYEHAAGNC